VDAAGEAENATVFEEAHPSHAYGHRQGGTGKTAVALSSALVGELERKGCGACLQQQAVLISRSRVVDGTGSSFHDEMARFQIGRRPCTPRIFDSKNS